MLRTFIAVSTHNSAPVVLGGLNDISWLERRSKPVAVIVAAEESAGRGGVRGALKSL